MATTTAYPQRLVEAGQTIEIDVEELDDYVGDVTHPGTGKVVGRRPFELVGDAQRIIDEEKKKYEDVMRGGVSPRKDITIDVNTGTVPYDPSVDMPTPIDEEPEKPVVKRVVAKKRSSRKKR